MTRSKLVRAATNLALTMGIAASMTVSLGAEAAHNGSPIAYPGNLLPRVNATSTMTIGAFEYGVADVTAQPQYTNSQPLLPQGWAFEGNAGLFDHSQHAHHTGQRAAAISIPLGGKRDQCETGNCIPSPLNGPKDAARQYYSVNPAWRTLNPVNVAANTAYTLKVYAERSFVTAGAGAFTAVRWLNSANVPIGYTSFAELRGSGLPNDTDTSWTLISATRTSPPGAAKAHILLGHTDDAFIGQVRFDDVCFGSC